MSEHHAPAPAGLDPRAWEAHRQACLRGEAGYLDPASGLFSPTSLYLRQRGRCCGCGCRHCPYPTGEQARAGRPAKPAYPWLPE